MTLTILSGDMFTSTAPAFGHGVNVDGVMGAGVAKVFRSRYPTMFDQYRQACLHLSGAGRLRPGGMLPWQAPDGRWVYNMASQDRPGPNARLSWLVASAQAALAHADEHGVDRIAIPQIGCGIGGLDWGQVSKALDEIQAPFAARFEVWVL